MFLDKDIWRNEHEKTCKKTGGSHFGNDNGMRNGNDGICCEEPGF